MGNPISSAAVGARYLEGADRAAGSQPDSPMTINRKQAEQNILLAAKQNGVSVNDVVTTVLKDNEDRLQFYVANKGETPNNSLAGLIVQSALLRADDIATLANASGLSEDEALLEIESAESQAIDDNTADVDSILPANANAALKYVIDEFQSQMSDSVNSKNLRSSIGIVRNFLSTPLSANPSTPGLVADNFSMGSIVDMSANANNGVGDDTDGDEDDGLPIAAAANLPGLGQINAAPPVTTITAPSISGQTTVGVQSPVSTNWAAILTGITATAQTVSGAISGTTNTLNSSLSNIGANSIQTYVSKNWVSLLLAVIVIIVLVIFISRGLKNK